jgi:hypothetical protein
MQNRVKKDNLNFHLTEFAASQPLWLHPVLSVVEFYFIFLISNLSQARGGALFPAPNPLPVNRRYRQPPPG